MPTQDNNTNKQKQKQHCLLKKYRERPESTAAVLIEQHQQSLRFTSPVKNNPVTSCSHNGGESHRCGQGGELVSAPPLAQRDCNSARDTALNVLRVLPGVAEHSAGGSLRETAAPAPGAA